MKFLEQFFSNTILIIYIKEKHYSNNTAWKIIYKKSIALSNNIAGKVYRNNIKQANINPIFTR